MSIAVQYWETISQQAGLIKILPFLKADVSFQSSLVRRNDAWAAAASAEPCFWSEEASHLMIELAHSLEVGHVLPASDIDPPTAFHVFERPLVFPETDVNGDRYDVKLESLLWWPSPLGDSNLCLLGLEGPAVTGSHLSPILRDVVPLDGSMTGLYVGTIPIGRPFEYRSYDAAQALSAAMIAFMRSKVARAESKPIPRAERRRQKNRCVSLIRVVTLREVEQGKADNDGHGHWSHRWIVRGHWRMQWYASVLGHRARYIRSHIKGPVGMPLIEKHSLISVSR